MKKLKFVEVRSEIGAGTRGASLGVDAIRIAALDDKSRMFKEIPAVNVPTENQLLLEKETTPNARRITGIAEVCTRVAEQVSEVIGGGEFPICLTGDHSSAAGVIAGVKMAYPDKRLGVVWIDAHADLHTPYTTPSGNVHGMPLAASAGDDNKEQKANDPSAEAVEAWEKLKNIGGISPKINYSDLVFLGVRDTEAQEEFLIKKHAIKKLTVKQIRRIGPEKASLETLRHLKPCDIIFVSYDVDSIDSKVSKGTGTPVPDGLSEKEIKTLVQRLLGSDKVACFEITEVNPTLDKENRMAEIAFEVLQMATNQLSSGS